MDARSPLDEAQDLIRRGEHEKAQQLLLPLTRSEPASRAVHGALSAALLSQARYAEAEASAARMVALAPEDSQSWFLLGQSNYGQKLPRRAAAALERAAEIKPDHVEALMLLGWVAVSTNEWQIAEGWIRRVLGLEPAHAMGNFALGHVMTKRAQWDKAEAALKTAVKSGALPARHRAEALRDLGEALLKQGKSDQAVDAIKTSLALVASDQSARMALAVAGAARANAKPSSRDGLPQFADRQHEVFGLDGQADSDGVAAPMRVFAHLSTLSLAGFVMANTFAATIKQQFHRAHLVAYWRPDRPFKRDVIALNHFIDSQVILRGSSVLPLENFDRDYQTKKMPHANQSASWYRQKNDWVDFHITPSMPYDLRLASFDNPARLSIPAGRVAELSERLVGLGVSPDRWLCTLHHREPTWKFGVSNRTRDMVPADYEQLIHRIIREMGGQVVRLGHPEMTRFQPVAGFVDLSRELTLLQAFAVSRSRFLATSPSGPHALGCALHVPTLMTNVVDLQGLWRSADRQLTQHLITPSGHRISQACAIRRNLLSTDAIAYLVDHHSFRLVRNSVDELFAAVRSISDEHDHVNGWREDPEPGVAPAAKGVHFPIPLKRPWKMLEFPELAPAGPVID